MSKLLRVACVLVAVLCAPSGWAAVLAIKAGHLIDPDTGEVTSNRVILVEGEKIVDILERLPVNTPDTVLDLSDKWVLPGLMDLHTHLSYNYEYEGPHSSLCGVYVSDGNGYRSLMGLRRAQDMLNAGFTTVREVGNAGNYVDTDLRRAIEAGLFRGPTIINSGKIIAPFGGQQDGAAPEAGRCWDYEYIDADGVEEVRKAVRTNIFYGAKVIKLVSDFRGGSHSIYTEEEIRAAADEAHRAGLTLAVHAKEDATARPAILGGADSIEHGYELTDPVLRMMKQKGVYLVGTDTPLSVLQARGPVSAATQEWTRGRIDRLRRAYAIGVPLGFGTDLTYDTPGADRGSIAIDFLQVWIAAGIPPASIVKAMTVNGAKLMKLAGERGMIAKGRYADIIAVPGNPLEDVRVLAQVSFVMKNGAVIRK